MSIAENVTATPASILSGQTVGVAVSLAGVSILGIVTPAALTGTTITFQVSADGTTYVPLYDGTNTLVSFTVAVSRGYYLDPIIFASWRFVKLVSGAAEAADRVITLLVRPV
jgi:hypothetical protein